MGADRSAAEEGLAVITGVTVGKIADIGAKDSMNMGAAMAPAAYSTISRNFMDFQVDESHYDRIITGDLGEVGRTVLLDFMAAGGHDLSKVHMDCGMEIYDSSSQDTHAGGSGCGCSAVTLSACILEKVRSGEWKRVLFVPTGALLSPVSLDVYKRQIIERAKHPAYGYFSATDEYYNSIIKWHETRNGVTGLTKECIGYENGVLGGVISALNVFLSLIHIFMAKMWAGRFKKETDRLVNEFNASVSVDSRLYREDIEGSMAHAAMLARQGIISEEDGEAIQAGLKSILKDMEEGKITLSPELYEDIHMANEQLLTERIGDAGKRLHTARSRNCLLYTSFW